MSDLAIRKIVTDGYAKIAVPSAYGRPARLEWLAIKQLVIDPEYQRDISSLGRSNVRKIAEHFNWSMFAPVIVAAAGSDRYAIVDGQHRTTAAALCGIDKVPCAIIEAKPAEQAAAFMAINGNVTKLSSMQLHYASLAAGDSRARRIDAVCKAAKVTVLRYPKDGRSIAVGETMAVVIIGRVIQKHGDEPVTAALRAINAAGGGYPGNLKGPVITALSELLAERKEWRGPRLTKAFDELYPDEMLQEATAKAARTRGQSATAHLKAAFTAAIAIQFGERGKAA